MENSARQCEVEIYRALMYNNANCALLESNTRNGVGPGEFLPQGAIVNPGPPSQTRCLQTHSFIRKSRPAVSFAAWWKKSLRAGH
jgi:hypothetical protein